MGDMVGPGDSRTTAPAAVASPFRVTTGLKYLGGFFGGGVALSALYATTGQGIPCPLRMLTGWECPLCGGTRLGSALLHGDLVAAFAYNPLIFLGLIGLTVVGVLWVVEALGGPKVRPPARLGALLKRMTATRWLIAGLVVSVAYLLLRNLL
ncbi:hypothetical protein GCM10028864_40390 [Microlunatus parietis]